MGVFLTIPVEGLPGRAFRAASPKIAFILGAKDKVDIEGRLLYKSANASDWATGPAKLCCAMCENFTDPGKDKTAMGDFARKDSADPPSIGVV